MALVDISLPRADGISFIRNLRNRGHSLPALILTASGSMDDTVRGLDSGADDYMTKPYRLPEVAARIRALIRRSNAIADAYMELQRKARLETDTTATEWLAPEIAELRDRVKQAAQGLLVRDDVVRVEFEFVHRFAFEALGGLPDGPGRDARS